MALRDLIVQIKTVVDSTGIKNANREVERYTHSIGGAETEMKTLSRTGSGAMGEVEDSVAGVTRSIEEVDEATADAGEEVKRLARNTEDASRDMNASIGRVKDAALIAAAAIVVAVTAALTVSVMKAADFEKGMAEVFTLIPGASAEMRDQLIVDAKEIGLEFGKLSDDVIPAMYQALSAGIPPENVFEFMQIASKAAIAGVTDTNTAVDGLTSVVNAYGEDVISASQVSDLMFTAVRLGKTTFAELSASVSMVTPMASALGVGFEEVAAMFSSMTAQGINTARTSTSLSAMFNELSSSTTQVGQIFQEVAGTSFSDFIAGGGTVTEALGLLKEHADDTGTNMDQMFGSVEASKAVLALTGAGAQKFADDIAAMGDSSGATEDAFATMADTFDFQMGRLKSQIDLVFVELGEKILPMLIPVFEHISVLISTFTEILFGYVDTIQTYFGGLYESIEPVLSMIWGYLSEDWDSLFKTFGAAAAILGGVLLFTLAPAIWATVAPLLPFIAIGGAVIGVLYLLEREFGVLSIAAEWLGGVVSIAFAVITDVIVGVMGHLQPVFDWIESAIGRVGAHFEENEETISAAVGNVQAIISWVADEIWSKVSWVIDAIVMIWEWVWPYISQYLDASLDVVLDVFSVFAALFAGDWDALKDALVDLAGSMMELITSVVELGYDALMQATWTLGDGLLGLFGSMWDGVVGLAEAGAQNLLAPINAILGAVGKDAIEVDFGFAKGAGPTMESLFGSVPTLRGGVALDTPSDMSEHPAYAARDSVVTGVEEISEHPAYAARDSVVTGVEDITDQLEDAAASIEQTADSIDVINQTTSPSGGSVIGGSVSGGETVTFSPTINITVEGGTGGDTGDIERKFRRIAEDEIVTALDRQWRTLRSKMVSPGGY